MTFFLKYRPNNFDSLVWQKFIKQTLKEAITKDKLVWAYLFCGPRWTWKTSTARIFAKAINCKNPLNWNPCLNCEICRWFTDDNLVDIIEIDAASYTWVDNIREIIEKAKFSPTLCKYKVYIIDEVHMLSKWAFNALLKILEEPPSHLKFILATTEIHKIPETILSRCQRYDFKSFSDEDLEEILLYIAKNENIKVDNDGLKFIIKEASGWARNAISLFEQLVYNDEINIENILNNYWLPKTEIIKDFYEKLFNQNESIIQDFENISSNYNVNLFFKELLFYIKDMMIKSISDDNNLRKNIFLLDTIEEAYIKTKNSFDTKTTFLVWVIKCIKWANFLKSDENISPKIIEKREFKAIKEEPKKVEIKQEELTHDDLFDVFWETEVFEPIIKNEIPEVKMSSNNNFKKDTFIENIKNIWWKWALTMSLRWSEIELIWNDLIITTKTKISLKQISDTESVAKMAESLNMMWFTNSKIVCK